MGCWRKLDPEASELVISAGLAAIIAFANAIVVATLALAPWLAPHPHRIVLSLQLANLAVLMLGLVHAFVTRRPSVVRYVAATMGLPFCFLCLLSMQELPTITFGFLVESFLPGVVAVHRTAHRAILGTVLVLYLFFALVYGLELQQVYPARAGKLPRAALLLWSLLAEGVAPSLLIIGIGLMDWQLRAKRRATHAALEALRAQQRLLEVEQRLSERLLHTSLPRDIAGLFMDRLRAEAAAERDHNADDHADHSHDEAEGGAPPGAAAALQLRRPPAQLIVARAHPRATVLFADIVGFSAFAAGSDAVSLVAALNAVFVAVDEQCLRRDVEKIKTIGDCYMACSTGANRGRSRTPALRPGHPTAAQPQSDDPVRAAADAVLGFAVALHRLAEAHRVGGAPLQFRIGVNTGPLVSGVIGLTKLAYDLWGDTVNTASRMESTGLPGMTQVTEATHDLLQDRYAFRRRGRVEVKGKGGLETFLHVPNADGPRPAVANSATPSSPLTANCSRTDTEVVQF